MLALRCFGREPCRGCARLKGMRMLLMLLTGIAVDLCLQRYEKPWYSIEQAQALLAKLGRSLPPSAQTLFLVRTPRLSLRVANLFTLTWRVVGSAQVA